MNVMARTLLIGAMPGLLWATAAGADVFKCTGKNGHIEYSERPCATTQAQTEMAIRAPSNTPGACTFNVYGGGDVQTYCVGARTADDCARYVHRASGTALRAWLAQPSCAELEASPPPRGLANSRTSIPVLYRCEGQNVSMFMERDCPGGRLLDKGDTGRSGFVATDFDEHGGATQLQAQTSSPEECREHIKRYLAYRDAHRVSTRSSANATEVSFCDPLKLRLVVRCDGSRWSAGRDDAGPRCE